jgi:membrane protease YdiL (CAAX protease family)
LYLVSVAIMFFMGGGQEEPGWRGFALPRMQPRFGPLGGAVLLGLLWGLWHLPLYAWVPDYNNAGSGLVRIATSFLGFLGYTVALSAILAWALNGTRGSVFLVMLVHATANATFGFAPETRLASWSLTLAMAVLALVIVATTRGRLGYQHTPDASATAAAES